MTKMLEQSCPIHFNLKKPLKIKLIIMYRLPQVCLVLIHVEQLSVSMMMPEVQLMEI